MAPHPLPSPLLAATHPLSCKTHAAFSFHSNYPILFFTTAVNLFESWLYELLRLLNLQPIKPINFSPFTSSSFAFRFSRLVSILNMTQRLEPYSQAHSNTKQYVNYFQLNTRRDENLQKHRLRSAIRASACTNISLFQPNNRFN